MGEVVAKHRDEVEELMAEMSTMVRFTLTVGMSSNMNNRLCDYAKTVKDFPTGLKEFEWRNGYFYKHSKLMTSRAFPDPTPMHTGYLEDGRSMGIISWELPVQS
jgi:hypothetical protein